MVRFKISADMIQLWILIFSGVCMLGGFWSYCEGHFAKADDLKLEIEGRRELKMEVDALYLRLIPQPERVSLKYHPKEGE